MEIPAGKDAVANAYDQWAERYDTQPNATRDLDAQMLHEHGPRVRGRTVLELGCGTGKNSAWIAPQCTRLVALDFSPAMLVRARARVAGEHVSFLEHDIRTPWPVDDASMDVVLGNLVLEHVEELAPVFAECARVLRKGGKLYFSELHPMRQLLGGQAHFADASDTVVHVPAFVHSVSEYVNAGLAAGFKLKALGEWLEEGAMPKPPATVAVPRLLTLRFVRTD
jgi:ubiquinone/menaquinone biosynthesis C-methylase UbiE